MTAYSLIVIFIYCVCKYSVIHIVPELKRKILIFNFGYRINFKYEGMLSHSFDRFNVVIKFILPTIKDLKVFKTEFDSTCNYLNVDLNQNKFPTPNIQNIKHSCRKIITFIDFYKKQIDYYN